MRTTVSLSTHGQVKAARKDHWFLPGLISLQDLQPQEGAQTSRMMKKTPPPMFSSCQNLQFRSMENEKPWMNRVGKREHCLVIYHMRTHRSVPFLVLLADMVDNVLLPQLSCACESAAIARGGYRSMNLVSTHFS